MVLEPFIKIFDSNIGYIKFRKYIKGIRVTRHKRKLKNHYEVDRIGVELIIEWSVIQDYYITI